MVTSQQLSSADSAQLGEGFSRRWFPELLMVVTTVAAGIATGVVWRLLVPWVQDRYDPVEGAIAADGLLGLLGLLGGLSLGAFVVARPGPVRGPAAEREPGYLRGALRLALAVVAGTAAGPGAAATAWALSGWLPAAWGVVFIWPLATTAVVFLCGLLRAVVDPPRSDPTIPVVADPQHPAAPTPPGSPAWRSSGTGPVPASAGPGSQHSGVLRVRQRAGGHGLPL